MEFDRYGVRTGANGRRECRPYHGVFEALFVYTECTYCHNGLGFHIYDPGTNRMYHKTTEMVAITREKSKEFGHQLGKVAKWLLVVVLVVLALLFVLGLVLNALHLT